MIFLLEHQWVFESSVHRCISINYNVVEKLIYFSNSTQIGKLVYLMNSMHTDWHSLSLWFINCDYIGSHLTKTHQFTSQQIRILHKTNKCFLWIIGLLESMFNYCIWTQYLVGAPFALITGSIRHGMEVISLWHCWGGMGAQVSLTVAFSSSAFFGLLFLIFLLTIPHRFSMGIRSGEFAGQSSTPTPWSFNQLLVLLAVWAGAKSCWKMKSASLKSWSAEGSMNCSKMYW